jgi:hypothetical protein
MKAKLLLTALAMMLAGCAQETAHRTAPTPDVGETGIGGPGTTGTSGSGAGRSGVGVDRQPAAGTGSLTNRAATTTQD